MENQGTNTSWRIVELVRAKISNRYLRASDRAIADALGVSRAAISAYKHGRAIMGIETISRAQDVLALPGGELAALECELAIERATSPEARRILTIVRDAVRHVAAVVLLAIACSFVGAGLPDNSARAASLSSAHLTDNLYIMRKSRGRLRRRRRRIWHSPAAA